jgi:hypothetical protein
MTDKDAMESGAAGDPETVGLEIAVEGENLGPEDVSFRHLAELLEATASGLEASAAALGIDTACVEFTLVAIERGSALYKARARRIEAAPVIARFYDVAKARAKDASIRERQALIRLVKAGRVGSVRLTPVGLARPERSTPIYVAPPLEEARPHAIAEEEILGRVVLVAVQKGDRMAVRLRPADGGPALDLAASADTAERAAKLFNQMVRARIEERWGADGAEPLELLGLEPWVEADLFDVVRGLREELAGSGVVVDESWLEGEP